HRSDYVRPRIARRVSGNLNAAGPQCSRPEVVTALEREPPRPARCVHRLRGQQGSKAKAIAVRTTREHVLRAFNEPLCEEQSAEHVLVGYPPALNVGASLRPRAIGLETFNELWRRRLAGRENRVGSDAQCR